MKQTVVILGATGSIGRQTLSVISQFPQSFSIKMVTSNNSIEPLIQIASNFKVKTVGFHDENLQDRKIDSYTICKGNEDIIDWIISNPPDILVIANAGVEVYTILRQVYHYVKRIAISSKEAIIMAGITKLLPKIQRKTKLLPIDSEHAALHQLLNKTRKTSIKKVVLTASGGPFFRSDDPVDFPTITPKKALEHPTWHMGQKVTIDSATLVNKGIELMEARYLFDLAPDMLDVVIHPESIIHAMIEFKDGSVLCQMAYPNMELPVAYSLFFPLKKQFASIQTFDYAKFPDLSFRKVSAKEIPTIKLAIEALRKNGTTQLKYLAADELAVELFLSEKIRFNQIGLLLERAVSKPLKIKEIDEANIVQRYFDIKEQIEKEGLS